MAFTEFIRVDIILTDVFTFQNKTQQGLNIQELKTMKSKMSHTPSWALQTPQFPNRTLFSSATYIPHHFFSLTPLPALSLYHILPFLAPKGKGKESEVAQSCLTLCNPKDYSQPGSLVHGILQARVLE